MKRSHSDNTGNNKRLRGSDGGYERGPGGEQDGSSSGVHFTIPLPLGASIVLPSTTILTPPNGTTISIPARNFDASNLVIPGENYTTVTRDGKAMLPESETVLMGSGRLYIPAGSSLSFPSGGSLPSGNLLNLPVGAIISTPRLAILDIPVNAPTIDNKGGLVIRGDYVLPASILLPPSQGIVLSLSASVTAGVKGITVSNLSPMMVVSPIVLSWAISTGSDINIPHGDIVLPFNLQTIHGETIACGTKLEGPYILRQGAIAFAKTTLPVGTMIPPSTCIPAGTTLPAGTIIPGGSFVSSGTVFRGGVTFPAGTTCAGVATLP